MKPNLSTLLVLVAALGTGDSLARNGGSSGSAAGRTTAGYEFLLDDAWIDRSAGVEWVLGAPARRPVPVLAAERPWETAGIGFFSMIFDEEDGKFKVWYRASCPALPPAAPGGTGAPAQESEEEDRQYFLCYAESADGIQWTRPSLGRFDFRGDRANNILWDSEAGDTVFYNILKDPADPDPKRRYKALGYDKAGRSSLRDKPQGGVGICVAFSADGVAWSDPVLVMGAADVTDADCVLRGRDPATGQWTAFFRPRTSPKRRFIGYATSGDFEHWTYPRMLLTPDAADDEWTEFYGMAVLPIGGWRVGSMWILRNDPSFSPMTNELVHSRDGVRYERAMPRSPLIPFGPEDAFDSRMLMPYALIEREAEVFIYYRGTNTEHGSYRKPRDPAAVTVARPPANERPRSGIGLARLPWGHFRGLRAENEGSVETKWLCNYGETGVQALAEVRPGGSIKAELLDVYGETIPGWSKDESNHAPGEKGALSFYWGQKELTGQAGQTSGKKGKVGHVIKVQFYLHQATLYGFRAGEPGLAPEMHPER